MTNIESLASSARTVRTRRQDTFPEFLSLADASLDCYFGSRNPEPALGECQAYTGSELIPVAPEQSGEQVIEYEKSLLASDLIRAIKATTQKLVALRGTRKQARRSYFQRLIAQNKVEKVYWEKHRVRVSLPERKRRILGQPPTKMVRRRLWLPPHTVSKWVIVGFQADGRPRWATRPVTVTRHVWRDFEVTNYKYVVVRKAGVYDRTIRTPTRVTVIDWKSVRAKYAQYKATTEGSYAAQEAQLRADLARLRSRLKERPKLMRTNTTLGAVSLLSGFPDVSWTGADYPILSNRSWDSDSAVGGFHARDSYTIQEIERFQRLFETEYDSEVGEHVLTYRPPTPHQGPIRMLDNVEQVYATDGDSRTEMLAYSSVLSLSKAKDTSFQWFRSLMELKDFKGDAARLSRGALALQACLSGRCPWKRLVPAIRALKGVPTTTVLKAMVGAYLSWKFAIQPTIQDIETVSNESLQWIFSLRRSLLALSNRLRDLENIFHARSKFGASKRILKLGAYHSLAQDERSLSVASEAIYELPGRFLAPPGAQDIQVLAGDPVISTASIDWRQGDQRQYSWGDYVGQVRVISDRQATPVLIAVDFGSPTVLQYRASGDSWINHNVSWQFRGQRDISASGLIANPSQGFEAQAYLPVFAWNHLSGVVFGAYSLGEVLGLSSELSQLAAQLDHLVAEGGSLASELATTGSMLSKHLDRTIVAWELTPLSFVYDWFTDSHSIVQSLSNFVRKYEDDRVPEPKFGIWETKRCELLAGTARYQPDGLRVREYVSDWHTVSYRDADGRVHFWTSARRLTQRYNRLYKCADDKAHLLRSGLYRVRRGENLGYPDILSYTPRIQVKLDAGKLTTLAAMLAGFTAPEG